MKRSKINNSNKLAIKMAIALILGLVVGIGCILLRENLISNGNAEAWTKINNILFQDISSRRCNKCYRSILYIMVNYL